MLRKEQKLIAKIRTWKQENSCTRRCGNAVGPLISFIGLVALVLALAMFLAAYPITDPRVEATERTLPHTIAASLVALSITPLVIGVMVGVIGLVGLVGMFIFGPRCCHQMKAFLTSISVLMLIVALSALWLATAAYASDVIDWSASLVANLSMSLVYEGLFVIVLGMLVWLPFTISRQWKKPVVYVLSPLSRQENLNKELARLYRGNAEQPVDTIDVEELDNKVTPFNVRYKWNEQEEQYKLLSEDAEADYGSKPVSTSSPAPDAVTG